MDTRQLALVAVTPDDEAVRRRGLAAIVAGMIDGGVTAVMFREKSLDDEAFRAVAGAVREACRAGGAAFLLNERVGLASELRPDAVHLTHASPPLAVARAAIAAHVALGVSTHSRDDVVRAAAGGADYVVHGPVHATPSKAGILAALGLEELAAVCRESALPVVAIGGIDTARAPAVRAAGAAGVAALRALFAAGDPAAAARELARAVA